MKWLLVWIFNLNVVDFKNDEKTKQEKYDIEWTWVCLDQVNGPTSSAAQAMLDLKDRPPTSFSVPFWKVRSEIDDESDNDCEDVLCIFFYVQYFNFIFLILFSDIIILMIKQADSRIMEEMRIMWSIRGWNGGSNGDLYDEEIFDVHILSEFLNSNS